MSTKEKIKKKLWLDKNTQDLMNRTSKQYPGDNIGEHFSRVGKIKRIQEWADTENSMSNRPVEPTPKKPEVKRKRERLLP